MKQDIIKHFFPNLNEIQYSQLNTFMTLILEWNQKINLISRKNTDFILERHLLPSLAIAKVISFSPKSKILDVGTGGGFPGIPLAILFPESQFLLVDSIAKKINVVQSIASHLHLSNVKTLAIRAENLHEHFDFVVARAVTALPQFVSWIKDKIRSNNTSTLNNGLLYLKGGKISEEIKALGINPTHVYNIGDLYEQKYCQDKCIIYFDNKSLY